MQTAIKFYFVPVIYTDNHHNDADGKRIIRFRNHKEDHIFPQFPLWVHRVIHANSKHHHDNTHDT